VQCRCTVWVKNRPAVFWRFFSNDWEFLITFTHLLYVHFYARLHIFIQLFPTLTNLYHTKRDHPANFFFISLELYLLSLPTAQMTSLLTSFHIRHVCWHYKSVYFIVTCHRQRSTKLTTSYANVWTHAFQPMADILSILCELVSRAEYGITSSKLVIIELKFVI